MSRVNPLEIQKSPIYSHEKGTPDITVIIPCFNARETICETLDSVLNQANANVEVIIVDDGSTDGTEDLLRKGGYLGRIVYAHQNNKGVSAARNHGLSLARGRYVCFLDSDDLLEPEFASQMYSFLDHQDARVAYCGYRYFPHGEFSQTVRVDYPKYEGRVMGKLISEHFIPTPCVVVMDRSALRDVRFNEEQRYAEDWIFWIHLSVTEKFSFYPRTLAHIRSRPNSLGNNRILMRRGVVSVMESVEQLLENDPSLIGMDDYAAFYYRYASSLIDTGSYRQAVIKWIAALRSGLPPRRHLMLAAKIILKGTGLSRFVESALWNHRTR